MSLSDIADLPGFVLEPPTIQDSTVLLVARSTRTEAACPSCACPTARVHAAYTRRLADLPWGAKPARLITALHRFRCLNPACARQTFVEPLPKLAPPYAHRTSRLAHHQQQIALSLGGEAGARLARCLQMATSPDTLLRLIRAFEPSPSTPPINIGIDDWALRKGQTYATIVVDLDTHRPIDILPERSTEAVATWLQDRPTIDVISRDRADVYINAATQGAPQAAQVTDRWHLMSNLGDAVQRMLDRHRSALQAAAQQLAAEEAVSKPAPTSAEQLPLLREVPPPQAPAHRQELFAEVKRLHADGWSIRRMSAHLQLNRRTVQRYVDAETVPVRILPQSLSRATRYLPDIEALWAGGCHSYDLIWRELQQRGFQGSYSSIRRLMKRFDPSDRRGQVNTSLPSLEPKVRTLSARQARWLLVRRTDELKPDDLRYRDTLCAICPAVKTVQALAQRFLRIVRERQSDLLDSWLEDAEASGIKELRNFALGLREDYKAVKNALIYRWSNGPVEAHVHRLKLIKRSMYGRAKFDLLRKRVLATV